VFDLEKTHIRKQKLIQRCKFPKFTQFSEMSFFGFHTCSPGPSSRYHLKFVVYKQALSSWYTLKQTNHNPQWSKGAQFHSEIKIKI
jgi:hypothetical protein